MNNQNIRLKLKPVALALTALVSTTSYGAITLFDDNDVGTVSVDASFNTFYVNSSTDSEISGIERDQSRVKMGFLPNWLGMNFSKEINGLKVGGRSSFWVSINDSNSGITSTGIDVRQFYATVGADWGEILIGKDFTLFNRSNIFMDEMLQGYGNVNDTLGLIDGQGVSFGNIGSGYTYPFPTAQITYRSPEFGGGFKLAVGLIDPSNTSSDDGPNRESEESRPRIEAELTYTTKFDDGMFNAWVGFLNQTTESDTQGDVDSNGVSYGAKINMGGFALHASGFSGDAIGFLLGPTDNALDLQGLLYEAGDEVESSGYLVQGSYKTGSNRFVLSYGNTEVETETPWEMDATQAAWFYNINSNVTFVLEYSMNEISIGDATEDTDSIAIGGIVNF
ncbi:porin [Alteromonas sp. C1M14]|uniref:porin n=1 Tax=Alteromonas sp. C1M14 TaxID=2841567 RepID=UPI001C093346|nr:porin [Alteromonas sp. C1M14]MBU2978147.1 porin [Alteromonas sp. C1M14]